MFKRRRFPVKVILVCIHWYCKYRISYRDLAEMIRERGVEVDPTTIMSWVHRYAPDLEKRVRWYQGYRATSWRVDETYVKVGRQWKDLFRTVDKHGQLIDFMLTVRRNTQAAQRFLAKALTMMRNWPPSSITTDKLRSYPEAIERLKRKGQLPAYTRHRTSKYLNNIIEADHGALKRVILPTRCFQTMKTLTGNQTYTQAPMSMLLLEDDKPLFTLQKATNTFSSRHHLRVFGTDESFDGERVLTASSTQDIGIAFSAKQKTFIHVIDQYLDNERSKVTNDLEFTGCVESIDLVPPGRGFRRMRTIPPVIVCAWMAMLRY